MIDYVQGKLEYPVGNHYIQGKPQGLIKLKDNLCTMLGLIKYKENRPGLITTRDNLCTMIGFIKSKEDLIE